MARITLSSHWKFLRLARAVGGKVVARGVLETLWEPCWVAGDAYCGTGEDIEALCEWHGEPGVLTTALLMPSAKGAGFIEPYEGRTTKGGPPHYQIHDFLHHCPEYVRKRRDRELDLTAPKVCVMCGDDYFSRTSRSQVCGERCRKRLYRERHRDEEGDDPLTDDQGAPVSLECPTIVPADSLEGSTTVPCENPPKSDMPPNEVAPTAKNAPDSDDVTAVSGLGHGVPGQRTTGHSTHTHTHSTKKEEEVLAYTAELHSAASVAADPPGLEVDDEPAPAPRRAAVIAKLARPLPAPTRPAKPRLPPPPPDRSPVLLTFPVIGPGGPTWLLREEQVLHWTRLYPGHDVLGEARHALAWIEANPTKRKTVTGMASFLVSWLNRSVDQPRGRSPGLATGSLKTAGNRAALEEVMRRRGHAME